MIKKLFIAATVFIAATGGQGDIAYAKQPTFTGIPNPPECVFGQDYVNQMANNVKLYKPEEGRFKDEWIKLEPLEEMMSKGAYTIGSIQIADYIGDLLSSGDIKPEEAGALYNKICEENIDPNSKEEPVSLED